MIQTTRKNPIQKSIVRLRWVHYLIRVVWVKKLQPEQLD